MKQGSMVLIFSSIDDAVYRCVVSAWYHDLQNLQNQKNHEKKVFYNKIANSIQQMPMYNMKPFIFQGNWKNFELNWQQQR